MIISLWAKCPKHRAAEAVKVAKVVWKKTHWDDAKLKRKLEVS